MPIFIFFFFFLFGQFVSSSGLRDVGAIASDRAASIYGLSILEEKMQVIDLLFGQIPAFISFYGS